ncbi:glycosylphosphatidylinositol-anchored high density lipoprotein-binding protein 1 isoform 1 precursor [Mus musculus]|uniref:Glycosylphosphatidylinositol-anchored high density lipoprotein-binding protein 1 n=1 Tax=Mus musculus TaxID=10090 RepID=HDBP1_MOUSE|nr:glycosylphosphatidylinositol-anchored high density lipoprotein-binding protein 1 isoform 1 precursor [Mus musculus]Q9D1N2.1 RecName: Full=Glycosylphosphatidylinositol-anchored high density lipoprotein-binding protein 1; Short=GPI-HBP1; Short=GPI-anchored HDL-binding protein 1; AltName: Full=High density lipoprotein-binding protein 1; Flags: Precursor [Mus musculus]AAH61225.1 GPI-anchored HDL-binding protein 1 [Mus musculus]EDL29479.1 GPI-anchored HDL-binding protein 1, isoform CRA_b [Mus musc|eukprot:NP_081006.1 glycosylphosphatidylinositol-anchored high density lipoprotein-binding protein 1 isoform 1 precursor [Mus musculus]
MKALRAVLLILLLSGQPGSGWAQEDGDADPEPENYNYDDDDDEEEEEETNMIPGSRDRAPLQCYFCQVLHSGESCNQTQSCSSSKPFCITLVSHSGTDKGYLTTYSMWCTDTCQPIIKTVGGTQMTQTCCQSTLCNIPPWQNPQVQNPLGGRADSPLESGTRHPQGGKFSHPQVVKAAHPQSDGANLPKSGKANQPQGSGAGYPSGWTKFGNIALLLSFFTCLWASGA